jgi:Fe-S oxidoreductase
VKYVISPECGHAYMAIRWEGPNLIGRPYDFKVVHILELLDDLRKSGRLQTSGKETQRLTYHDPCQMARNGGVIDEPRYILKHLTDDFREMSPEPNFNWCCGGGGGLVALGEDTLDFRMKSARVKVDQVRKTEAAILSTACENCHEQLKNLNDHYKMGMEVKFLSSMVADALVHP